MGEAQVYPTKQHILIHGLQEVKEVLKTHVANPIKKEKKNVEQVTENKTLQRHKRKSAVLT